LGRPHLIQVLEYAYLPALGLSCGQLSRLTDEKLCQLAFLICPLRVRRPIICSFGVRTIGGLKRVFKGLYVESSMAHRLRPDLRNLEVLACKEGFLVEYQSVGKKRKNPTRKKRHATEVSVVPPAVMTAVMPEPAVMPAVMPEVMGELMLTSGLSSGAPSVRVFADLRQWFRPVRRRITTKRAVAHYDDVI
jgi:hypothetical protein